jgi:hypothetical protein
LSEINNRVRISYTVEIEEIPTRITTLLREYDFADLTKQLAEITKGLDAGGNLQSAIAGVDALRRLMMKLDLRLEDCQSLLSGYQQALAQLAAGPDTPDLLAVSDE